MKKFIISLLFFLPFFTLTAQISINTDNTDPDASAMLDIKSSTKGLLIPRLTTIERDTLSNPAIGLMIYNATTNQFNYYDGTNWTIIGLPQDLSLSGNTLSLTNDDTNVDLSGFVNTDNQDLRLIGDSLSLDNDNTKVGLNKYLDNTDEQDLSLSGSTLSISGGNSVNLSGVDTDDQTLSILNGNLSISEGNTVDLNILSDHDWYLANTTNTLPSAINNNIYTNGNVGIGNNNPVERLSIYPDQDESAEIGRAHIGSMGHNNWAGFSHIDMNATGSYALLQSEDGTTLLNAATGKDISIRNNNTRLATFSSNGNFGVGTNMPDSKVEIVGDVRLNGNNAGVIYENKETNKDWRLVYVDGFETDKEGWISNGALTTGDAGLTRRSMNIAGLVGHFIQPIDNNYTLKKFFNTSGLTYKEVKIEFNYLFLDSWDTEIGWLAVTSTEAGNPTPIWNKIHEHKQVNLELNGINYNISFYGNSSSDLKFKGEAQFSWSGGGFWLEFGANLDSAIDDETFGIDNFI